MRSIDQTLTPRAVPRYENSTLFQKSWVEASIYPFGEWRCSPEKLGHKKLEKKHIGSCVHARTRFIAEVLWLLRWYGISFKFHARRTCFSVSCGVRLVAPIAVEVDDREHIVRTKLHVSMKKRF